MRAMSNSRSCLSDTVALPCTESGPNLAIVGAACPNVADQKQILALLKADEIGIVLSDEDQLEPEQSTSAIVVHHPQAKYFSV